MKQEKTLLNNTITIKCGNSYAEFKRAKLLRLNLDNVKVINTESNENSDYLGSGCYLMYPWVGRIKSDEKLKEMVGQENLNFPFKDNNNFPIHGFFANSERKVIELNENSVTFAPEENTLIKNVPYFMEKFTLYEKKLEIETIFKNHTTNETEYFAYGYHPYITIDNIKIDKLILKSNINTHCILNSELMPSLINESIDNTVPEIINDLKTESVNLNSTLGNKFYDDLFYHFNKNSDDSDDVKINSPFISLTDSESTRTVKIESDDTKSIKLNYYQMYTPPSRDCIAVEPMTSPSNAFNINFPKHLMSLNPGEEKEGKFTISIN